VPIEVTMPKLSPTMETGVIAQWLVKVGDQVKEGDVLADIETDKATMPMKSYDDGTIVHIDHAAGDEVSLGQRVMVLAMKNEDPQKVAAGLGVGGQAKAAAPAAGKPAAEKTPSSASAERAEAAAPAATGVATNGGPADHAAGNGQPTAETGNGRSGAEESHAPVTGRIKASPLAKKLAAASGIDLARVRGSGPGGRIVRRDVEDYLKAKPPSAAEPTVKVPAPPSRPAAAPLAAQRIPHSRMRKTIAQRMVQAKQAAPEIHLTVDIRADRLVAAREELNKRLAREGVKLSLGDFVTKAVAMALRAHPGVNASFEPDAIVRHGEVNIGIAVALPEGLIVPVLHRADTLGLREIRKRSETLAAAARSSTLSGEQLTGSTFTISNLGMYGIRQFDAILNMPEVGILAVGTAEKRPIVEGDKLVVGTVMTVTLTADHRAVDGAMAAEFLQTLRGLLEEPTSMLL
jgi:pyruvate dehydrogenase E2 component (dihydrolipoamide acetyltransferase)